jgi:hypothetical protein
MAVFWSLLGYKTFPDVGGSILGSSQYNLSDGLTTFNIPSFNIP